MIAQYLRQVLSIRAFPILNTLRPQTLRLRGEVNCAIGQNSHELMITLEHVISKSICFDNLIQVFLVDHNELSMQWPEHFFSKVQVVGIIDHHVDGSKFAETCHLGRVVTECGSNASLVIQEIFQNPNHHAMDFEFLTIALFPIIYDTKNLTYRSTAIDQLSSQLLINNQAQMSVLSADDIWTTLLASEVDELDSSLADLLYKDFKKFSLKSSTYTLGMSTMRASLYDHMHRNQCTFLEVINQFLIPFFSSENLDGMILIFSNLKSQEYLFLLPDLNVDHIIKYFNATGMNFTRPTHEASSVSIPVSDSDSTSYATAIYIPQLNYQFNRKQTYPLFEKYLLENNK